MHIMHNLQNPRCTACTKCRARQSDKPLKVVLSIIFCGTMAPVSHLWGAPWPISFSVENDQCSRRDRLWSVVCTEKAYRRSYRTYRADMCTTLCIAMHIWRQTKSISVHAHMHTCTKRICWEPQIKCKHVISWMLFHRHGWDAVPPRNFFYCCTSPQIPLHTAQKDQSHVHNSAA
jgi:hypothetical protein